MIAIAVSLTVLVILVALFAIFTGIDLAVGTKFKRAVKESAKLIGILAIVIIGIALVLVLLYWVWSGVPA